MSGFPSYRFLRTCSFIHSAIYLTLLAVWAIPGLDTLNLIFGYGHGIGWICMTTLALLALRRRTITFAMAALISIGGAIGPFVGSIAFLVIDRRRRTTGLSSVRTTAV